MLLRPKFKFDSDAVGAIIAGLFERSIFVDASRIEEMLPDPKDAVFYEVVMETKDTMDSFLVTGNIKHFPNKPFIVTPREMLEIIEKNL